MTRDQFKSSLSEAMPPEGLPPVLQALWHEAKGDWETAHAIAQDITSSQGAVVHAYLHRKEGDEGNASYWYSQAGRSKPHISLAEEWDDLVSEFLKL